MTDRKTPQPDPITDDLYKHKSIYDSIREEYEHCKAEEENEETQNNDKPTNI